MKEIVIRNNYNLADVLSRFTFGDDLPVVIAYCPLYPGDGFEASLLLQVRDIRKTLRESFGPRGCNIVWVFEELGAGYGRREGLHLVAELLRQGYSRNLAIHRVDRIARTVTDWLTFSDAVLQPHNIDVLVARKPLHGSHPDVEWLHWFVEHEAGMATVEDHPHIQSFIEEPDLSSNDVAAVWEHCRPTMFTKHS